MLKVLIAEDEVLVRIGLKNSVNWAALGMEVIGDVSNGRQAWELYCSLKPDIVLTDIKMPVMDGLELIARIRNGDKSTKVIILTCYEEFEYLHEALKLSVSDYILKLKMSPADMEQTLEKVKRQIQEERRENTETERPARRTAADKGELIKRFLFYGQPALEDFAAVIIEQGLRLNEGNLLLSRMVLDDYGRIEERFADRQGDLIRHTVLNIVEEILDNFNIGEVIHEREAYYLLLFSFKGISGYQVIFREMGKILRNINQVLKNYLNVSVSFGASQPGQGYQEMGKLYEQASHALEERYFGRGPIFQWGYTREHNIAKAIEAAADFEQQYEGKLPTRSGLTEKIRELEEQQRFCKQQMDQVFIEGLYLSGKGSPYLQQPDKLSVSVQRICDTKTLAEGLQVLEEWIAIADGEKERVYSPEILRAVKIIEEHLEEKISLGRIAEEIGLSQNYLSTLFKKELNISFTDYINRSRMEKAKELLLTTNLRTYQVAELVGFGDDSYFSRTFKRFVGIRPHLYRKEFYGKSEQE